MNRREFFKVNAASALVCFTGAAWGEVIAGHEDLPYAYMHIVGRNACGGRAMLMPEIPPMDSAISSSQFRRLDGSRVAVRSQPTCGTCGKQLAFARHAIKFIGNG